MLKLHVIEHPRSRSVSENQNEEGSDHLSYDYDIWMLELNGFEHPFDVYEGVCPS